MSKIPHLVLLALLLSASIAAAQPGPLLVPEHDWTLKTRNGWYGVYQSRLLGDEKYGAGTSTAVYFGQRLFTVRMRAGWLVALMFAPLGAVGALLLMRSGPKKETRYDRAS